MANILEAEKSGKFKKPSGLPKEKEKRMEILMSKYVILLVNLKNEYLFLLYKYRGFEDSCSIRTEQQKMERKLKKLTSEGM